jgi:hypothetical protein
MDLSDDTSGKLSKKSIELLARPGFSRFAYSAVAVFLALLIGAILIGASGYSVKEAYYNLFMGALCLRNSNPILLSSQGGCTYPWLSFAYLLAATAHSSGPPGRSTPPQRKRHIEVLGSSSLARVPVPVVSKTGLTHRVPQTRIDPVTSSHAPIRSVRPEPPVASI